MQTVDSKEVIVFLLAANIIVVGMAVFFFLIVRIQQKRKQSYQKKLLEKELKTREEAIQQISRDLHDEIGSSLSGINMLTLLVLEQIEPENTRAILKRINTYSNEVIEKVNDMAWLLKPSEESLGILLSKLKKFGLETANSRNMEFKMIENIQNDAFELSIIERKAIYLIGKEAINNAVKYSGAKVVECKLSISKERLHIVIADNGRGLPLNEISTGNGLKNMEQRAREIGASFELSSIPEQGVKLEIELKAHGEVV